MFSVFKKLYVVQDFVVSKDSGQSTPEELSVRRFGSWCRCAVTSSTVFGGGLVEENSFSGNQTRQPVAGPTLHVAVGPLQRKCAPLIVIKKRWLPFGAVVTTCAGRCVALGELPAVDIFVAILTLGGGSLEIHIDQPGLHVGRLVTVNARRGPMRSQQRKRGFGMIKPGQFPPGFRRVARLAAYSSPVRSQHLHAFLELPLVRVRVTTGAGQFFPAIKGCWPRLEIGGLLVAIAAGNCDMSAG